MEFLNYFHLRQVVANLQHMCLCECDHPPQIKIIHLNYIMKTCRGTRNRLLHSQVLFHLALLVRKSLSISQRKQINLLSPSLTTFGPLGIEPSLQTPHACVLPIYYGPTGGPYRDRTGHLAHAMRTLYQMS